MTCCCWIQGLDCYPTDVNLTMFCHDSTADANYTDATS